MRLGKLTGTCTRCGNARFSTKGFQTTFRTRRGVAGSRVTILNTEVKRRLFRVADGTVPLPMRGSAYIRGHSIKGVLPPRNTSFSRLVS